MARIRTIKPEFWSDENLSECSLSARLLFIGLISHADDEGRLEYSPTRIRMQVFPCGSATGKQITEWLQQLTEHSLIEVYEIDSKGYIGIPGFAKHQRINRPTPSRLPKRLTEDSLRTPAGLEGKGRERKGSNPQTPLHVEAAAKVDGLDTAAWAEWVSYRTTIGKPIEPASIDHAIAKLLAFGSGQRAAVDHSIANGYQGLFAPKGTANGNGSHRPAFEEIDANLARLAGDGPPLASDVTPVRHALG